MRTSLTIALAVTLLAGFPAVPALSQSANPIVSENQQPGTSQWQIPNAGFDISDDTTNQIKGYASAPSVNKGGSLNFYVTVNPVQTFTIAFYRMGWYGGQGGRLMLQTSAINGIRQASCPTIDATTRLVACSWVSSYTLTVPATWTDGVYLAVLSNARGFQNYVPFVVRNDARTAALLYQQPSNTYQAYNNWGGRSLYTFNSTGGTRAYKVSFDRPYADDGSADYFGWEVFLVQWLEQKGYDVTYSADVDGELNAARLRSVKGVLIPGHSEYWSKGMYDAAQSARDAGVGLAFIGSNDVYWQVRYESNATGAANRVLVCYKTNEPPNPTDPITATNPVLTTTQWREAPVNRPEQALIGVQFTSQTGNDWDGTVSYVVTNASNWVYAGTGFSNGTSVPRLTGYEADKQFSNYPRPVAQAGTSFLLASSPYRAVGGGNDTHNSSIYQAPSGAWVFATGSQAWPWGLTRSGYINAGIQTATTNVLNRFVNSGPPPPPTATPTSTPTATPTWTATPTSTATSTPTSPPAATATPTNTLGPATLTPRPTNTLAPATLTPTPTATATLAPATLTPTPTPTQVAGTSAYRAAVMADAPLAYWRLGEASGTVAADQLNAHNGTYANNPTLGQAGALFGDPATSVNFNGTTQYVQAPSDPTVNPSSFSVEVWARPTGGTGAYHGVMASRSYPQGWALYEGDDGSWEFWVNSGSGMNAIFSDPATQNAWHHVVGTFDGTTMRLYVNGVLASSTTAVGYQAQTVNPIEIAQSEPGGNLYFNGWLQEPAIYGTALSATQIQRHYSVGTTGH